MEDKESILSADNACAYGFSLLRRATRTTHEIREEAYSLFLVLLAESEKLFTIATVKNLANRALFATQYEHGKVSRRFTYLANAHEQMAAKELSIFGQVMRQEELDRAGWIASVTVDMAETEAERQECMKTPLYEGYIDYLVLRGLLEYTTPKRRQGQSMSRTTFKLPYIWA